MPIAIKYPKFLLLWLSLLLVLLPISPSSKLAANFAPPIEPAQYQSSIQPTKAKKAKKAKKKPRPNNHPNLARKRFLGGLGIAVFGTWFTGMVSYGALWAFIASIWGTGALYFFFWALALVMAGAAVVSIPAIIYSVLVIDNSYMLRRGKTPSHWPRLRREYSWGIFISLLYGLGAVVLLSMSYFAGGAPVAVAIFGLMLVGSIILLIYNIRNYHRDKPSSRSQQPNNNPDEYK